MILTAEQIEILVERRKNGTLWAVTPDVVEAMVDSLVDLQSRLAASQAEIGAAYEKGYSDGKMAAGS